MYFVNVIRNASHDSKKMWNILNDMMGSKSKSPPSFLESEGHFIITPVGIANHLSNFFNNKVEKLRNEMCQTNNMQSQTLIRDQIMRGKKCTFEFTKVNVSYVEKLLLNCKDKPSGVDNMDVRLLKLVANLIATPVCHMLNLSFEKCVFPQAWKIAKIVPLPKNATVPFSGPNSRPISLLPAMSKIMEKIAFEQIQCYFSANDLNTDFQHAYRGGHSTSTALIQMTDDWHREINNKNLVGAVLLDFSAAFDIIDHNLLLQKLKGYGFNSTAILWLGNYLANRKQTVYFNGHFSEFKSLNCGIPQGSCLGPLLFSVFTNELPLTVTNAKIAMYADDSTIYVSESTIEMLNNVLNNELQLVLDWVTHNKLVLNVSKTKSLVFGTKHLLSNDPKLNLYIKGMAVEQVQKTKLLGIIVDSNLSWAQHIGKVVVKMGRGLSVIRRCSHFLPKNIMGNVIKTIVLAHLDYCSEVWSGAAMSHIKKLQIAQNKAARCLLRCSYRSNVKIMHNFLSWLSVKNRFTASLLNFTRKISVTKLPRVLYKCLSFSSDKHNYNTRHAMEGRFTLPKVKTNRAKSTALYRAMSKWNTMPGHIIQENCKNRFKLLLKKHLLVEQLSAVANI